MGQIIKEKEDVNLPINDIYEIYDLVDAVDANDNPVVIKKLVNQISEKQLLSQLQMAQKQLDKIKAQLAEINKIKALKV